MGTSGLVETAPKKIGESYSWLVNDYLWLMVDDYLWLMVRKYLSGWWEKPTHLGKIFPSNPMKFPLMVFNGDLMMVNDD